MKRYIHASEDLSGKYGIFRANAEVREKDFDSVWDIVSADTNVEGPIEVFNTLEEANAALAQNYHASIRNERFTGGRVIWGDVYFTAEIDEDGNYGDAYNITDDDISKW